ncbi:MAG: histidine kinase dimerization/phospho-acceptor domain-containing protein, partial [Acidimicrobiia bacterium]|nr:histidine kinase dimerization/phospho-acceptor domain-containing protein [Acidimicrobiia bacterium]
MTTYPLPLPRARVAVPMAIVIVLLVSGLIAETSDPEVAGVIGTLGLIVGHGTAGVLMFRRSAALPDVERRPWRLLASALMIVAGSLVVFAAMIPDDPPVFGPVDIAFVVAYVMFIVALGMLARMHRSGPPWGITMLDSAVAAVAASALIWELVLSDLGEVAAPPLQRFGLALYPVLDVGLIVGLCLVAIRRSGFRFDPRLLLLAGAFLTQVVADILYLREGLGAADFTDANPHFGFFLATAALVISVAAIVDRPSEVRPESEHFELPLWAVAWPYLLAFSLVPLHFMRVDTLLDQAETGSLSPRDTTDERVVLYALLALGVLIFVRQTVAIRHNRRRMEQQRRDLISSVSHELRTPLTAIHGFLQLLESDPEEFSPQDRHAMLSDAAAQTRQMSRTVTDIITLARDGGSTMLVQPREITLSALVERCIVDEGLGLHLTTDVDDHRLLVDADRL